MPSRQRVEARSRLGSDRKPKWRFQSIEGVHCGDHDREINEILGLELVSAP
jgi:hypothetical protein